MNNLDVRQRKMVYAGVALLLFIGIIALGRPATARPEPGRPSNGGLLAKSRHQNSLGEASLGEVDPTSATMNLVLLGLRGVAASVLWQQADHYKQRKNFQLLEETVESIILLQPHFKAVWEYQAWNLAYNVSAECDAVDDRYHWVKRGAKFLIRGTEQNQKVPELFYGSGWFFMHKIGRADEQEVFREFFLHDPDEERWKGGPDEDINPEHKGNYLVAKDWFLKANQVLEEPGVEQHRMDTPLFVAYPYRSQIEHARAMQKDGVKEDISRLSEEQREETYENWARQTRDAYDDAYDEWTRIYGHMELETSGGGTVVLETDDEAMNTLAQLAEEDGMSLEDKQKWQENYRRQTLYTYWKMHCDIERRETMMRARYQLREGRRLYEIQEFDEAKIFLERGLNDLAEVVKLYETEDGRNLLLSDEDETVDDAMKAILIWQQVLNLLGEPIPNEFPLRNIWDSEEFAYKRSEWTRKFAEWQGWIETNQSSSEGNPTGQ
ncbi:MAG: hypothetical protein KDA80_09860 [Planctomycetaceae bacterium]|nr:hypothetical protein [Planctomycetaceae bacterium]